MSKPRTRRVPWKQRPLVIGEHRSVRRRRSWRAYYSRNCVRLRREARARYWRRREHALAKQRQRRRRQWKGKYPWRHVSEREWSDIRRFYEQVKAMGESCTFKELAVRFLISPSRIQRRSSADGGWAMRATPEPDGERP
jgi:hypothetical protein